MNILAHLHTYIHASNCGHEASEFDIQSPYYVHFQTNTLYSPPPAIGLIVSLLFFYKNDFGIK